MLFRQGDLADELVVLLQGRVTARIDTPHGRVVTVGTWTAPSALDKVALLTGHRHTCTAQAAVDCSWRSMSYVEFERLIDDAPSLRRHVLSVLASRAATAQRAFVDASTLPVTARLARWLLQEAADTAEVELAQTQEELAQVLGVTRVTLSRALLRLRDDQLIRVRGGHITLVAPEALLAHATQPH